MIDDSYNRYAFNGDEDLPAWYLNDEIFSMRPEMPITKEEVEEMKERFRAINARPIKKVAEARARKKRRSVKKMERAKKQAEKISQQSELSEREKIKEISRLYNKLGRVKKPEPVYVVRRKFQSSGRGPKGGRHAKVKIVDPRMKTDKRAEKRIEEQGGNRRKRKVNRFKRRR